MRLEKGHAKEAAAGRKERVQVLQISLNKT